MASNVQAADFNLAAAKAEIEDRGYTILHNLLPTAEVEAIRNELSPYLQQQLMGRNNFEGRQSERVYALLAKCPQIASIIEQPTIIQLLDHFLDNHYLLSANLAINVHPGETPQPYHADHASVPNVQRTETNGISVIWAIDDFTETNGATELIPYSHQWTDRFPTAADTHVKAIMSSGSALVFHGSLYHRGGANTGTSARLAITPQYCQPWLRQLENMVLAVPPDTARQYSDRIQSLLGYSIREPGFMGYVDGLHPKRLVDSEFKGRHARGLES